MAHRWRILFRFLDTWLIDWFKGINKMSYSHFGRIEGLHKELWNFEGVMLGLLQVVVIGAFGFPPGLKFKYAEQMKESLIG